MFSDSGLFHSKQLFNKLGRILPCIVLIIVTLTYTNNPLLRSNYLPGSLYWNLYYTDDRLEIDI